jgi:CRISPR-associated protein Cmr1
MIPEHISGRTYSQANKELEIRDFNDSQLANELQGKSFYWHEKSNKFSALTVGHPDSKDGYLAFPLRDNGGKVYEGVSFRLYIRYPNKDNKSIEKLQEKIPSKDIPKEIQSAIWAWETFGGIGARTRRGFGAISLVFHEINNKEQVLDKPQDIEDVSGWIQKHIQTKVVATYNLDNVPSLGLKPKVVRKSNNDKNNKTFTTGKEIWRYMGEKLKKFRQSRPGRGRSYWPEPNTIRFLSDTFYKTSTKSHEPPLDAIRKFPRAAFGLPISFAFKNDQIWKDPKYKTDYLDEPEPPGDNMLEPKDYKRLSSPLILRPLELKKDNDGVRSYVGIALILKNINIPKLKITVQKRIKPRQPPRFTKEIITGISHQLTLDEARRIEPLKNKDLRTKEDLLTHYDILKAFLDTL